MNLRSIARPLYRQFVRLSHFSAEIREVGLKQAVVRRSRGEGHNHAEIPLRRSLRNSDENTVVRQANHVSFVQNSYLGSYIEELARKLREEDVDTGSRDASDVVDQPGAFAPDGEYGEDVLLASARLLNRSRDDAELARELTLVLGHRERMSLLQAISTPNLERVLDQERTETTFALAELSVSDGINRISQRLSGAATHLREAANRYPDDWRAHMELGIGSLKATRGLMESNVLLANIVHSDLSPDEAVQSFQRAADLKPDDEIIKRYLRIARQQATRPIIFVGLPRSASVFVYSAILAGLGKPSFGAVMGGAFPDYTICPEGLSVVLAARGGAHTHLRASKTNLLELGMRFQIPKMMVHVRDPRQVLMSWLDWMPNMVARRDPVQSRHYGLPSDFADWSSDAQLDWLVDHWLPIIVTWLEEWQHAPDFEGFETEILFTSFEDLKRDQAAFFDRVLDFFEIDHDLFEPPSPPSKEGDRNFRKGDVDSWREAVTGDRLRRMRESISDELLEFYGWAPF